MRYYSLTLLIILLIAPALCHGQINENDITIRSLSLPDTAAFMSKIQSGQGTSGLGKDVFQTSGTLSHTLRNSGLPRIIEPIRCPGYFADPGTAVIPLWHNGAIKATGSISKMPGLMQIESGTLGIKQSFGNFSVYAGAVANKYGYYNGLHTQYGVAGILRYDFSPKASVTASGTYYFGRPPLMPNGMPMPPAMFGYYRFNSFRITYEYQFNETFGFEFGARVDPGSENLKKYELRPVANPTIKIGGCKFSIPMGEILYEVIKEQMRRKH